MDITKDLFWISLIIKAPMLIKSIMLILLLISILNWTFIFHKMFDIKNMLKKTNIFEHFFWSSTNLVMHSNIKTYISNTKQINCKQGLELIFQAGIHEFYKTKALVQQNVLINQKSPLSNARRAMYVAYQREIDKLELHLNFFASIGSVSPYIGLFGTVCGIINTFHELISNSQHIVLANIIPSIAEALIVTAISLFTAIPAVIAYNYYSRSIDRLAIRFENFINEFSNILEKQTDNN